MNAAKEAVAAFVREAAAPSNPLSLASLHLLPYHHEVQAQLSLLGLREGEAEGAVSAPAVWWLEAGEGSQHHRCQQRWWPFRACTGHFAILSRLAYLSRLHPSPPSLTLHPAPTPGAPPRLQVRRITAGGGTSFAAVLAALEALAAAADPADRHVIVFFTDGQDYSGTVLGPLGQRPAMEVAFESIQKAMRARGSEWQVCDGTGGAGQCICLRLHAALLQPWSLALHAALLQPWLLARHRWWLLLRRTTAPSSTSLYVPGKGMPQHPPLAFPPAGSLPGLWGGP